MARDQKLLLVIGIVGMLVALLYLLGQVYFLFWKFVLFDKLLHFLGGVWVTFFCYWISRLRSRKKVKEPTAGSVVIFCLLASLLVGIGWEVYEDVIGLAWNPLSSYLVDTITDLAMDLGGGLAAALPIIRYFSSP